MSDLYDALGDDTRNKLKSSRAWVLAQLVSDLLYNGGVQKTWLQRRKYDGSKWVDDGDQPEASTGSKRFVTTDKPYISSWVPDYIRRQITGDKAASFVDTERLLREVMHELERIAVKENT